MRRERKVVPVEGVAAEGVVGFAVARRVLAVFDADEDEEEEAEGDIGDAFGSQLVQRQFDESVQLIAEILQQTLVDLEHGELSRVGLEVVRDDVAPLESATTFHDGAICLEDKLDRA